MQTQIKLNFVPYYSPYRNIVEAASFGAIQSIKLVANITVNILAFLAILELVNECLRWMGHRVGLFKPELTFGVRDVVSKFFVFVEMNF